MKAGAEASTGRLFFSSRPGGGKNANEGMAHFQL